MFTELELIGVVEVTEYFCSVHYSVLMSKSARHLFRIASKRILRSGPWNMNVLGESDHVSKETKYKSVPSSTLILHFQVPTVSHLCLFLPSTMSRAIEYRPVEFEKMVSEFENMQSFKPNCKSLAILAYREREADSCPQCQKAGSISDLVLLIPRPPSLHFRQR